MSAQNGGHQLSPNRRPALQERQKDVTYKGSALLSLVNSAASGLRSIRQGKIPPTFLRSILAPYQHFGAVTIACQRAELVII
jgi:hypothetical protein